MGANSNWLFNGCGTIFNCTNLWVRVVKSYQNLAQGQSLQKSFETTILLTKIEI